MTASLLVRLALALMLAGTGAHGIPARQSSSSAQASAEAPEDSDLINPDRPGIADGSRVIGARRFQIETGLQQEFRAEGDVRTHTLFVPTLMRVGLGSRWESRVEGNTFTSVRTIDAAGQPSTTSGFAPLSGGIKFAICDRSTPQHWSLATIARAFPASGSGDFKTRHVTGDVRLVADWDLAPKLSLNPNVGVGRYEGPDGNTFVAALGAVTLNFQPTDRLNPFVDIGYQGAAGDAAAFVIVDAGVAWIVRRDVQLDVSVGNGIGGDTPRPFVAIGISLRGRTKNKT